MPKKTVEQMKKVAKKVKLTPSLDKRGLKKSTSTSTGSAAKKSSSSHQKDLAKISGQVASRNATKPGPKAPKPFERGVISRRAEKKTLKSFK